MPAPFFAGRNDDSCVRWDEGERISLAFPGRKHWKRASVLNTRTNSPGGWCPRTKKRRFLSLDFSLVFAEFLADSGNFFRNELVILTDRFLFPQARVFWRCCAANAGGETAPEAFLQEDAQNPAYKRALFYSNCALQFSVSSAIILNYSDKLKK